MKEKELLEKEALEKLFQAQKRFQDEKRLYNDAIRNYYKTLENIEANYPEGNHAFMLVIEKLLAANKLDNFEIKKYNNSKIFDYMALNISRFICQPEFKKDSILELKPNSINKFSAILATLKNNYLFKKILKNNEKPNYIHKLIKPVVKDTYGIITFEEQAREIINLILDANEYETDIFYESLAKIYKLTGLNNLDSSISIIDHIRKNYCEIYVEQFKTPYFAFVSSAIEKGIKENKAKELFNLLLAYFIDNKHYYRNEKILEAKQLYKIAFIKMNYPNKLSEVKNEN